MESLEALTVLIKNGIVPTPLVDVASEGSPEGSFCDVRVSESLSQFVLISVAEAESEIWDVPRALKWLMLCQKCQGYISCSLSLKSVSKPVHSTTWEIIKIGLSKVALVSEECMHSCVKVTSKNDSVSFSKINRNLNILRSLIESVVGIEGSLIGVI